MHVSRRDTTIIRFLHKQLCYDGSGMDIFPLPKSLASRKRRSHISTVVLHATAGSSLSGALSALRQRELSYHYLIAKDGKITKAVPYTREAFHAGTSFGPEGGSVNRYSIGISFVNRNDGIDPYTQEQLGACRELLKELKLFVPYLRWLTTHRAIAPTRKSDPRGLDLHLFTPDCGLEIWG